MRYNEKELQALSRQPAELAAELGMRGPRKGSVVKRRLLKLVVNFLFYFRTDEAEPVGALLLEHCRITQEEPSGFSITFRCHQQRLSCGSITAFLLQLSCDSLHVCFPACPLYNDFWSYWVRTLLFQCDLTSVIPMMKIILGVSRART
nr:pleckstrin homology domain-containing family J member 1 isoform X2 [Manis javanica]